jgi:2-polyprenyl-3-methyl-5-hydroxy-6-metoxy-1,4-benzoquinol methylase
MKLTCRHCATPLERTFCDLGMSPLANSYVDPERASAAEPFYPLHAYVCSTCFLVQLQEFESPQHIFGDYLYFSSFSSSWLDHARRYVTAVSERFGLASQHLVVEIASNDGYLLQYFQERQVPVLGIEPAANVAKVAEAKGIPCITEFFGTKLAEQLVAQGKRADLIIGNNVLAHVPDLNDFVRGLSTLLGGQGLITLEFPHLLRLIQQNQFDTIYHEHFSYLSLLTVERVFRSHGLRVFDVEQLPTHGGSLRIYATHLEGASHQEHARVAALREEEAAANLANLDAYTRFEEQVQRTKRRLLSFLIEAKEQGKTVVGYGAPAKGNTLLNYCGVKTDLVDYTVDLSPHKQGHYLPGTRIPIHAPSRIAETKPDYLLVLPWNLRTEITKQMAHIREWGGRFVFPIPVLEIE